MHNYEEISQESGDSTDPAVESVEDEKVVLRKT